MELIYNIFQTTEYQYNYFFSKTLSPYFSRCPHQGIHRPVLAVRLSSWLSLGPALLAGSCGAGLACPLRSWGKIPSSPAAAPELIGQGIRFIPSFSPLIE